MGWTRRYFLLILTLFLAGCASNPIDFSKGKTLPQGEAIVFGRVGVIYKGEPKIWKYRVFLILVLPTNTSEAFSYGLLGDGSFYWHLPPGAYAISGFDWIETGRRGRIFAEFVVAEGEPIIYIGKLTLDFVQRYRYVMRVEDDYDLAIQKFKEKFPEIEAEPTKNLMKLEVLR